MYMNRLAEAGVYVLAAGAGVGAYALTQHYVIDQPEHRANEHNAVVEECIELSDEELVASEQCLMKIGDTVVRFSNMDRVDDHLEVGAETIREELEGSIKVVEDRSYSPHLAAIGVAGVVSAPVWVKKVNWYGIPKQKKKNNQEPDPVDRGGPDKV